MPSENPNPFDILLPYQRRIFADPSPRVCVLSARQCGKSLTIAAKAVWSAITTPNSLTACISTGERAGKELLLKIGQWAEACSLAAPDELKGALSYTTTATEVRWGNGSRVIVLPAGNPAALRGYSGNVICDEFALVENDDEVWAAIAPLITSRMGGSDKWILVASTPTSQSTRFARIFLQDPHWSKHKITIEDAVEQGLAANIAELQATINDDLIWRTEYLCEFADGAETPYLREYYETDRVVSPDEITARYLGCDVARTNDRTAIVVLAELKDGSYFVEHNQLLLDATFEHQIETLESLWNRYRCSSGYIDSTGIGLMFAEEAQKRISPKLKPFSFTASNKTEIFDRLLKISRDHRLNLGVDRDAKITDLQQMKRYVGKTGAISYTAPHTKTGHSDFSCGLALALAASHDIPRSHALPVVAQFHNSPLWTPFYGRSRLR